jgi:hypothetical protein|tara:strand:+ start:218 stop:457 length:240 start_codon:yes stop_codon:yes gene_type:complete
MPRYRLDYGDSFDFYAQTAGEVVPILQERHIVGFGEDERSFCRRIALEMCEWNSGDYYFHSRSALAESMFRNGLLEVID